MSNKYKAAVIGCGRSGSLFDLDKKRPTMTSHCGAYTTHKEIELIGICDSDREKLQKSSDLWKVKNTYTDYQAMILDNHLDYRILRHSAEGGAGIILDIKKNEILAMNSLPQYNPNHIEKMNNITEFNNSTLGVYELGSLFKSLTGAIALDKNILNEETIFDARKPLVVGKFKIHDFEAKKKKLKFSECILSSSNICFALIGQLIGEQNIREYYQKMKLTIKPEIELSEVGNPIIPKIWRKTNIMTMSYGHGIAISPLQFVNAFSSIVNEGQFRYSTLIKDKLIKLDCAPGMAIVFNDKLLHGGVVNKGSETRISIEFVMCVNKEKFEAI